MLFCMFDSASAYYIMIGSAYAYHIILHCIILDPEVSPSEYYIISYYVILCYAMLYYIILYCIILVQRFGASQSEHVFSVS